MVDKFSALVSKYSLWHLKLVDKFENALFDLGCRFGFDGIGLWPSSEVVYHYTYTDLPDQSSQVCQPGPCLLVQKELWSVWKQRKTEKEVIAMLVTHEICWKYDEWMKCLPLWFILCAKLEVMSIFADTVHSDTYGRYLHVTCRFLCWIK